MKNVPVVKLGIIAVSRDCFPLELSTRRRRAVTAACLKKKIDIVECEKTVENENDVLLALAEAKDKGVNALVIFLGNFGPEGPTSLMAQRFDGPVMIAAAAEESRNDLIQGRGDAYCGMLSSSYNNGLRKLRLYVPAYPVGDSEEVAEMISEFIPVARVLLGVKGLKIFSFGPRPQDFLACNAPIKPLYDLGIEIMENSELDLYDICQAAKEDPLVRATMESMSKELGAGNTYPELIERLAWYEVALRRFMEKHLGASRFGIFANKCWPSFQKYFGHVPCFINGRLAAEGIPVACEVDIYGALSEYMAACATLKPPTLLDINNTVPKDMIQANRAYMKEYKPTDLFMGFHCGNVSSGCMIKPSIQHQLIMHRLLEPDQPPTITRGTLEGRIQVGPITLFRLQSTADTQLKSYMAQGEVLDIDPHSFGGIGVFAVREMSRFYRHVFIGKRFPHHTAIAFAHAGKTLFNAVK
ncbi:fucose isomerase, partial [bacterium]|nr:fucose isomerase [bacterium]